MPADAATAPPEPVAAVIFDVDGVLVASPHERAWRESLTRLMEGEWAEIAAAISFRADRFTTAVYQEHVAGKPRMSGAAAVLDYFGVPDAGARAVRYAEHKQLRIDELIDAGEFVAFADAIRFVIALKKLRFHLAAASSSRNANHFLCRIPLSDAGARADGAPVGGTLLDVFDANVCGRDVEHGKPHPDLFLLAAAELGVAPAACMVVEDAPAGVEAAKSGGMLALGVARLDDDALLTAAGADLVVSRLDDVQIGALAEGRLIRAS